MIIVFGSLTMDMAIKLEKLPVSGETVLSQDYDLRPGGKGANQALAAARAGAKVALVGRIGNDNYGRQITDTVKSHGVMVSGVGRSDHPTGTTILASAADGKKQVIILAGANKDSHHDQVPDEILTPSNWLLMQMELPLDQNLALLERAHARGVKTVLNLAPAISIPKKAMGLVDLLIVNSLEARQIAERLSLKTENNAIKLAQALSIEGQMNCIVTLGAKGSVVVTKDGQIWAVPSLGVDQSLVVDVAGSGDAYCGTLVAGLHAGMPIQEAMRRASVAASLTCLKAGAMDAIPFSDEIEEALKDLPQAQRL
jgi:ribokinase